MVIEKILNNITTELKNIPGVVGVVLGGSRARGTNHQDSDIDIGIYYDESERFNVNEIDKIATKLDDEHRKNLVSSLGEWGPWVNAGGWLIIQGYHVDFIFRDINRVSKVINDCLNGKISSNYQTGHPHAYLNAMYMGEVAICKVLDDPKNKISELKAKTIPYPENLKNAIIGCYMFEASFSLMFTKSNIDKDDISYVCGHCFRSISSLNQVLFALNNEYCINEKKAVKMIDTFKIKPVDYKKRIDEVITLLSSNENNTRRGLEILEDLVNETKDLC
ncbi:MULTISPECIES: nucleotidyltransferase domain-containing protein [unclassified Clostridium]|uniref:nucleotidyltransferase domain-containing protein n=1 Tax=unclassified Clostridium TaxID=2614128 RepID=UPI0018981CEE|nr:MULTISPECIES: nucleotidyltransferase domain-containing protein [unclassified Clostridium]MCR1949830.1 nucleotidyltransferase domain-containing protein [Clostridium sp. DSM 100503]